MRIIYVIIKILTFPAAYIKFFTERIMCRFTKTEIEEKYFFRTDELLGHAEHTPSESPSKNFLITAIPGLISLIFGAVFFTAAYVPLGVLCVRYADSPVMFCVYCVFLYLAAAFFCNLFPTVEDSLFFGASLENSGKATKALLIVPKLIAAVGSRIEKYGISFLICAVIDCLIIFFG